MHTDPSIFFDWVKHTREGLFTFLRGIPEADYRRPGIAGKSILEQQVHIVSCYHLWVGQVLLAQPSASSVPESLAEVQEAFAGVNRLVTQAIASDRRGWIQWTDEEGHTDRFPAAWLLLHPITHEFHHKGQLILMARMLGYTYPEGRDSDLRFAHPTS